MSTGSGDLTDWEQDYWAGLQRDDPTDPCKEDREREKRQHELYEQWEREVKERRILENQTGRVIVTYIGGMKVWRYAQ
jgi:hypothetical protein